MWPLKFRDRFSLIADDSAESRAKLFIFFGDDSIVRSHILFEISLLLGCNENI